MSTGPQGPRGPEKQTRPLTWPDVAVVGMLCATVVTIVWLVFR